MKNMKKIALLMGIALGLAISTQSMVQAQQPKPSSSSTRSNLPCDEEIGWDSSSNDAQKTTKKRKRCDAATSVESSTSPASFVTSSFTALTASSSSSSATPAYLDDSIDYDDLISMSFDTWKKSIATKDARTLNLLTHVIGIFAQDKAAFLNDSLLWTDTYEKASRIITRLDNLQENDLKATNTDKVICSKHDGPLHNGFDLLYTAKLLIPSNALVRSMGDIHANFETLDGIISQMIADNLMDENLKLKPKTYFIGFGDYVDRGDKSLETLATLLLMSLKNPDQVFLIRGNHENVNFDPEKLIPEIQKFAGATFPQFRTTLFSLFKAYEFLPSAIYLGYKKSQSSSAAAPTKNKFLLLSHGSVELRYDAHNVLGTPIQSDKNVIYDLINDDQNYLPAEKITNPELKKILMQDNFKAYYDSKNLAFGFHWNDVDATNLDATNTMTVKKSPRGSKTLILSFTTLKAFLALFNTPEYEICGLIGGHDHCLAKMLFIPFAQKKCAYELLDIDDVYSLKTPSILTLLEVEQTLRYCWLDTVQNNTECTAPSVEINTTPFVFVKIISGPIAYSITPLEYAPTALDIRLNETQNGWRLSHVNCTQADSSLLPLAILT